MTRFRTPADLSHAELAALGREYLLAGHLIDRAGMPNLLGTHTRDEMGEVAIDEWMGASPIYTPRMQRALGFGGDGSVETIFKGIQLDVGSPPGFMDFRFVVHDHDHGEFWLDHCGALMDVEPMGDDFVHTMCHTIEDPTFDATALATNPRAQVRPVHRPPRMPADRHPHCHWTVDVVADADPAVRPPITDWIGATVAGELELTTAEPVAGDQPGRTSYEGPLVEDLPLDAYATPTLRRINDEVALQGHLLVLAFLRAVEQRWGSDEALALGQKQFVGVAGVVAMRLQRAFGAGDALADIGTVLALHPAFHPRAYVDWSVTEDADGLTISLGDCPGTEEPSGFCWPALLDGDGGVAVLDAIVQAVDPTARCSSVAAADRRRSWRVTTGHPVATEPGAVTLTKFSTGADFVFAAPQAPPVVAAT